MPFEFQVGERPGRQYRAMTRFHITEGPSGTLRPSPRARAHSAGASAQRLLDCFARCGSFADNWRLT
jgi:hypothetical protein